MRIRKTRIVMSRVEASRLGSPTDGGSTAALRRSLGEVSDDCPGTAAERRKKRPKDSPLFRENPGKTADKDDAPGASNERKRRGNPAEFEPVFSPLPPKSPSGCRRRIASLAANKRCNRIRKVVKGTIEGLVISFFRYPITDITWRFSRSFVA